MSKKQCEIQPIGGNDTQHWLVIQHRPLGAIFVCFRIINNEERSSMMRKFADVMEHDPCVLRNVISNGKRAGWNTGTFHHPTFEFLGELDELTSLLGVVKSYIQQNAEFEIIEMIQQDLFLIQAEVGSPDTAESPPERINNAYIIKLAQLSGQYEKMLPSLAHFVIPGQSIESSFLHYARAVSRRVERYALFYNTRFNLNPFIPVYLDRLSYLLFQLSRKINQDLGILEKEKRYE